MKRVSLEGIRLFSQLPASGSFSSQVGVTLLRGRNLLEGEITGFVTAQSENDFRYDEVYVNYYYSKDIFLDREVNAPSGIGYSLDALIQWQPTKKTRLSLEVRNIVGYIFWKKTPFTSAQITSNNKTFDENGYVTVSPVLSGKHEEKNVQQRFPRMLRLTMVNQLIAKTDVILDVLKPNYSHCLRMKFVATVQKRFTLQPVPVQEMQG